MEGHGDLFEIVSIVFYVYKRLGTKYDFKQRARLYIIAQYIYIYI